MARLVLLFAALATLAACGGGGTAERSPSPGATADSPSETAVELEGETLEGERFSLAALRGKPVFVNVWASW